MDCEVCWDLCGTMDNGGSEGLCKFVWTVMCVGNLCVLFTGYGILYITFISPLHHHYNIKWNKIEEDCFITFNVYVLNKVAKMYKI